MDVSFPERFSDFKKLFCSCPVAGCFTGQAADRNDDNDAKLIVQYQFDSRLSMTDTGESFMEDKGSYNDES